MENSLIERIYQMMSGSIPTAPRLTCPHCGGTAFISASPWRHGKLAVSIKCGCIETQFDGVEPWSGWEAIRAK